jgi:hypothetical protein
MLITVGLKHGDASIAAYSARGIVVLRGFGE